MNENLIENKSSFKSMNFFVEVIKSDVDKTFIVRFPRPDGVPEVSAFGDISALSSFFGSL